jgi:hypothetical protein
MVAYSMISRIRAAIPQGLADNSNTLLAFAGGNSCIYCCACS